MNHSLRPDRFIIECNRSERRQSDMRVFTLGYQQINLQQYLDTLLESDVGVVLDVRAVPWSYKRGFSKGQLQKALESVGIDYIHIRSAGNPSSNRKTAKSAAECLRRYRQYLNAHPACIDELLPHIRRAAKAGRPACLTCFEKHPTDCHRSILIDALEAAEPKLSTTHLAPIIETAGLQLVLDTKAQRS